MADWLNLQGAGGDFQSVVERLQDSPFDELVEFDLNGDLYRNLYHIEGKYFAPVLECGWREGFDYIADHMIHPDDRGVYAALMEPADLRERLERAPIYGVLSGELRYRGMDGNWIWTRQVVVYGQRNGLPEGIVRLYIYDISVQKERERGRMVLTRPEGAVARRDDLTGLLVEREFFNRVEQRLPGLEGQWCVVAVDIESFKLFCDWHGQQAGNYLLTEIGESLRRLEQETGGLAGYRGQDDFCLLIPYDAARIDALFEELQALIIAQGGSVGFLPIFGICMVRPGVKESPMDLYNHAALTAEQLKGDFRNRIRVYNPAEKNRNAQEYRLLADFQRGLENHELFFCLQPQCRVSTGRVVGAEALARWRAADGTLIPPADFVPILEKYGMVTNLDKFVWDGVCAWLRKWLDAGHEAVPVSVNVSQVDIFTIDVPAHFNMLLEKYRLPAKLLKVEITESAYVEDTDVVRETVRRLRERGFLVLMDDFGSGYSSLNMLSSLNVDIIKLDAQFLHISENESRKGVSILESIVSMAKNMSIPVIVEGVETQEQINFLSDLGCRYMQGFYFHRPMTLAEFEDLIRDRKNIDLHGFEFKANEQLHTREFLDENVVSDAMLNNILGPVAFYRWHGDDVDILRFNQQFYLMVGIELSQLEARRTNILGYFFPDDRETLLRAMKRAVADRLNGAKCVVRVYKPNGALVWISMQLYFMEEDDQGKRFYGACEDVSEMQYVNVDIPGGYHRCAVDGSYEFYYISQGFQEMTGYTAEEIREKFDNRFLNMVHRDDLNILQKRADAIREGREAVNRPYRLKRKGDGYIYVVNQSRVVERDGQVCFQSVAIDVNEMVKLRNQMRLLSRFSSDDVLFVRKKGNSWKYHVVVHGLEAKLGVTGKEFEKLLNAGVLYRDLQGPEGEALAKITHDAIIEQKAFEFDFELDLTGHNPIRLHMKTDFVQDKTSKVDYICILREA